MLLCRCSILQFMSRVSDRISSMLGFVSLGKEPSCTQKKTVRCTGVRILGPPLRARNHHSQLPPSLPLQPPSPDFINARPNTPNALVKGARASSNPRDGWSKKQAERSVRDQCTHQSLHSSSMTHFSLAKVLAQLN